MVRLIMPVAILVVAVGLVAAGSGRDGAQAEPRLIGLVELPGLFGTPDPAGPPGSVLPGDRSAVVVHAEPVRASPVIGKVGSADSIEWREASYEAPAAVAFGVSEGWVRIAVGAAEARRHGWVSPAQVGPLHLHGELVEEGLAYLTGAWDGALRDEPSTEAVTHRVDGTGRAASTDVDVLDVREVGGVTWLEVALLAPGRCRDGTTTVVGTGWAPALAGSGEPVVWFHARGC